MKKKSIAAIGIGGALVIGLVIGLIISSDFNLTSSMMAGTDKIWHDEQLVEDAGSGAPPTFAPIVKKAMPGVVIIYSTRIVKQQPMFDMPEDSPHYEFFRRFFNMPKGGNKPRERRVPGLGSGFIINEEGYVLTNHHVVAKAPDIEVELENGNRYKAEVVGSDQMSDLALLKIDADEKLTALPLGDSDAAEVGDWVIAIGSPFSFYRSVTVGVVSYKARTWSGNRNMPQSRFEFIQTDAPLNVGNSGGPLLNTRGQVVGINSAIFSPMGAAGGNIGIGFAIPSNLAKDFLPQLMEGKVTYGWLGVYIQEITPELASQFGMEDAHGALVSQVVEDSPAAEAGVERGDVIIEFDGTPINQFAQLPSIVARTTPGTEVEMKVLRFKAGEDEPQTVTLDVEISALKEGEANTPAAGEQQQPEDQMQNALGLTVANVTADLAERYGLQAGEGVIVTDIEPDSPAETANLSSGDVILEVNRNRVNNVADFMKAVGDSDSKDSLLLLVRRGDSTLYVVVNLD